MKVGIGIIVFTGRHQGTVFFFGKGDDMSRMQLLALAALFAGWIANIEAVRAATPTADQALKLVPVQKGVDYDAPSSQDVAKCKITVKKVDGQVGWIVEDPDGMILRRFLDTNGDNVVDQWSYYKDGIEVYRDIDANFNGKADQYRWFNTAGTPLGARQERRRRRSTPGSRSRPKR